MTKNIGSIDRILRLIIGAALVAAALGLFGVAYQSVWAWIGVVPLVTALVGSCPLYSILGMSTCSRA